MTGGPGAESRARARGETLVDRDRGNREEARMATHRKLRAAAVVCAVAVVTGPAPVAAWAATSATAAAAPR